MDYLKLEKAKLEAKRFLWAAEEVRIEKVEATKTMKSYFYIPAGLKENGACLRASLDLTRALSDLRKP